VEDDALKVARACMPDEVLDCLRRVLREQLHMDVSEGGVDDCTVRKRSRTTALPGRFVRRDGLLLAGWSLIEDVTASTRFGISVPQCQQGVQQN